METAHTSVVQRSSQTGYSKDLGPNSGENNLCVIRFSIPNIIKYCLLVGGYMCAPDELLGAGVDLVPGVGLVSVAGDDQLDLGGPGPVLGQLDELLVVARH